ncbi:putative transposase for insertion sequence element IS702 [Exaiptasia diaphana]|nr:putative transposase for insertion sequence element IS702 [Exaiptasia diaphana]
MYVPPFPTSILMALFCTVISLKLWSLRRQQILPPFPAHIIANMIMNIAALFSTMPNRGAGIARIFGQAFHRRNVGTDVYSMLRLNRRNFWYVTGETCESFDLIVRRIGLDVTLPRQTPRTPTTNRRRACILDVSNRVLVVVIWLRHYLKLYVLASAFGISKSTVAEEIYHIVPIIFIRYRSYIRWHSLVEWRNFLNTIPHFPNAVGYIDATTHRIRRPSGPRQADFYRRDKKCHFMSTQLVLDSDGLIVLLVAGFPGRMNDAETYRRLPAIGHGLARNLPRNAKLLADGGYANRQPLITPRRIPRNRRQRNANRALRAVRVRVEHAIGFLKVYASCTNI